MLGKHWSFPEAWVEFFFARTQKFTHGGSVRVVEGLEFGAIDEQILSHVVRLFGFFKVLRHGSVSGLFNFLRQIFSLPWHTHHLVYQRQLLNFWLAWKNWSPGQEFSNHASDRPNIDCFIIVAIQNQNLRSPIPSSYDFDSFWLNSSLELPRQTEVSDFDNSRLGQEEIATFNIAVHYSFFVEVSYPLDYLLDHALEMGLLKFNSIIQNSL